MVDAKEVAYDALNEIYDEAEPGLDFDYALANPDEFERGWYDEHYLDSERQREILQKHLDEHSLTKEQETSVTMTVILNYGPRGYE